MVYFYREDKPVNPEEEEEFVPSLLNGTVYIISMALQISTFAINYRVRYVFILLVIVDLWFSYQFLNFYFLFT